MWPLSVSCRIWFSSACRSCVFRLVRLIRRPICRVGSNTNGRTVSATAASLQSLLSTTNAHAAAANNCRRKSAIICDVASCTLSTSFMMDDMSWPVECASKNCAPCFSTLLKTELRRAVTAEKPGVAHQVVAQVIADALHQEHGHNRHAHHRPDGGMRHRYELVQVELASQDRVRQQGNPPGLRVRVEHAVEDRLDEQQHHPLRRRRPRPSTPPRPPGARRSAAQRPADGRVLSCRHLQPGHGVQHIRNVHAPNALGRLDDLRNRAPGPPDGRVGAPKQHHGRHSERSRHVGRPRIVPHEQRRARQQRFDLRQRRPARARYARNGERSSPAPPRNTGSRPVCFKCSATARNPSARQAFSGAAATA